MSSIAAMRVAVLAARIVALEAERDEAVQECGELAAQMQHEYAIQAEIEAVRDRYEKALREIESLPPGEILQGRHIARAALAPISEVPDDGQETT
jgi:hypothetical protein